MKQILVGILYITINCNFLQAQTIEEVSSLYNARKYEKAESSAMNLVNLGVEDARLFMLLGRTLADQDKINSAITYLERSVKIENAPTWVYAWSYAYLGSCLSKVGEYVKARVALNECVKLDATLDATKTAKNILAHSGLVDYYANWAIVTTEGIRFHFQDSTQFTLAMKSVLKNTDRLKMIKAKFPCELPKSIDYFVWSKIKEANEILNKPLDFALPEFAVVHTDVRNLSGYELISIISNHAIQPESKSRIIDKGLSVYFSQEDENHIIKAKKVVADFDGVFSFEEIWKKSKMFPDTVVEPLGGAWIEFVYANFSKDELNLLLKYQDYISVNEKMGEKLNNYIIEFQIAISQ